MIELRQDGLGTADHTFDELLTSADARHGVAPDLLLHGHGHPTGLAELTEGCRARAHGGKPRPAREAGRRGVAAGARAPRPTRGRHSTRPPAVGPGGMILSRPAPVRRSGRS